MIQWHGGKGAPYVMHKLSPKALIRSGQFRQITGVTPAVFFQMVRRVHPAWRRVQARKAKAGRPHAVGGLQEHLVLLLIVCRCHVTQGFMGWLAGTDKASICRALQRIAPIARSVLGVKRAIKVSADEAQALLIDATEQPIERPQRGQKRWYSGKKKRHCVKAEVVVSEKGRIAAVSRSVPGTVADIALRRRGPPLPDGAHAYMDSGYQGYQDDHPDTEIPYKKSKKRALTPEEKAYNTALSRLRVRAEHAIGRMKRFRILSDRWRYPRASHGAVFSIIAGIANLMAGF